MLTVNGGGGFNRSAHSAGPTPKACGLVLWFFGIFVIAVCIAIKALAVTRLQTVCKVAACRPYSVLRASREQLGCEVGCRLVVKRPTLSPRWPQDGPKRAPGIILGVFAVARRAFLGPSWAHLGLSWALLGPSWGVPEGILRQILGLEGLILGCKVAKS